MSTVAVYMGALSPFLIAFIAWMSTRNRTGAETTEKITLSLNAALDRADKEREAAELREHAALERETAALTRESRAAEKARRLQHQLDECVAKAEDLQRQLDVVARKVTTLQDQVAARDETINNQAATIRSLRGSNGSH